LLRETRLVRSSGVLSLYSSHFPPLINQQPGQHNQKIPCLKAILEIGEHPRDLYRYGTPYSTTTHFCVSNRFRFDSLWPLNAIHANRSLIVGTQQDSYTSTMGAKFWTKEESQV